MPSQEGPHAAPQHGCAGTLDARVERPSYDRSAVTPGIVHFGVGGFHRAHEAMYLDRLMNDGKALDWGICGVGALPHDRRMRDVMAEQDCLYTLVVKHPDGTLEPRVIGSIVDYLFAPDDPEAVLETLADPATRIVSLTITEGGYLVNPVTGEFDASDAGIQADLARRRRTRHGLRVHRRGTGPPARPRRTDPFTVMSCDNIPGNGDVARRMLTAFARLQGPRPGRLDRGARSPFPNSMVDRITPVTTDDDRAAPGRASSASRTAGRWCASRSPSGCWRTASATAGRRCEDAGVQLVPDVEPYELMKLRLLNASHQALCYLGYLAGYRYAHEVCQDPLFAAFLLGYMDREATPTLPPVPGVDLDAVQAPADRALRQPRGA